MQVLIDQQLYFKEGSTVSFFMFKYWYLPLAKDPAPTLHLYRATDQFQRTTSCKLPDPNRRVFLLKPTVQESLSKYAFWTVQHCFTLKICFAFLVGAEWRCESERSIGFVLENLKSYTCCQR